MGYSIESIVQSKITTIENDDVGKRVINLCRCGAYNAVKAAVEGVVGHKDLTARQSPKQIVKLSVFESVDLLVISC